MLRPTIALFGLTLLLMVSTAQAQGPRGGRGLGGGPGGGRGGPGMGPTVSLVIMPEVQKELATTEAQNKAIETISAEVQDQMRETFGSFRDLQDLSDEERQQRMEESRKKFAALSQQSDEKLAKLLEPQQVERLGQIRLQREGLAAFARPETAKALGLSEEQQAKIRTLQDDLGPGGRMSREDREKAQAEALAVLSDEQKSKWTALKGKQFEFPQPPRGVGGGGRGGFGGDRGGPGGGGFGGGRGGRGPAEERVRPPSKKD